MSDNSAIEWTDATWNPVTGCTKVSPGCKNCYAERFAERFRGTPDHPFEQGFDLRLWEERLDQPLRWRSPRRIFVNSMSDLFHEAVPEAYIPQEYLPEELRGSVFYEPGPFGFEKEVAKRLQWWADLKAKVSTPPSPAGDKSGSGPNNVSSAKASPDERKEQEK